MKHIRSLTEVQLDGPSIVTIGNFDGVHRGHQQLVARQVCQAHQQNALAVVLTFFPHPCRVIRQERGPFYLTSSDERVTLLADLGVDLVVTHPFDDEVRRTRAADFVDQLLRRLRMSVLCVGPDFAMGYEREGDVPFLTALGQERGFEVRVIEMLKQKQEGKKVSSRSIREALRRGAVERAARDLGRPYRVVGPVVGGAHRGQRLGFPTANLAVWAERMVPAAGVYAGWAWVGGQREAARRFAAVTNVGVRPTFDNGKETVEIHLLDFDEDLYGQAVVFEFVARLRDEQRFDSVEALVRQIKVDVVRARGVLGVL